MGRLIIISNRLPVSIQKNGDQVSVRQSSGGLVSALISYFEQANKGKQAYTDKSWVGSMDASEEDWQRIQQQDEQGNNFTIWPIFPDKAAYEGYYNGFANSTIWPLFHYFPNLVENRKEYFNAYTKINQLFAQKVVELYQPGDLVWVHDYQLMLLPSMLREKLPEATIGFFLHIPFPSYEIFRLMPTGWKRTILNGMLGADLVGFHTHDYTQHFIQSAKMILRVESQFNTVQYQGRSIKVDQFPIGIDYQKFRQACIDDEVVGVATGLEEKFYDQKIIFSVDRLDYTKGVSFRLEGYEQFLDNHPEWLGKVVFILNIIPSRDAIPTYIERKKLIEEKISTINGKFSSLHWQPLIYRYNHLDFEELCALYQVADVALITPLRDGMNLVAKEYIASCIDKGVLILSELTGAASELSEAILVNPTDVDEVAEAIVTALNMPLLEQRSRLSYMQRRLAEYDVIKWINDFIDTLMEVKQDQEEFRVNVLREATVRQIEQAYRAAAKRCILLDYDGTLAPFQKLPSLAVPGSDVLDVLRQLAAAEGTEVIIISGRDGETLEKWLGNLPVTLVAEHGARIRMRNEGWIDLMPLNTEWKEEIRPIMKLFSDRCPGAFVEEKRSTLAWHYRNSHPELGFNKSRELRNSLLQLTANTSLQVIDGNKVLEVRPVGIDKGSTANIVLSKLQPDFILCIGDDATDEDMFRSLKENAYTIKIGRGSTSAQFTIPMQREVLPFLKRFIDPALVADPNLRKSNLKTSTD